MSLTKARILSYGVNQTGDTNGYHPGIHAEYDAIRKLLPLKRKKKLTNVNLLVIRISGKNKLQLSKPCVICIETMKTLPKKLGYNIKHIYYSTDNEKIVKSNLIQLSKEKKHYSKFYRNKQKKIEL